MEQNPLSIQRKSYRKPLKKTEFETKLDFSRTDVRGVQWKRANLQQVNFFQSCAGLTPARTLTLQSFLIGLAVGIGVSAEITAVLATALLSTDNVALYTALPGVAVLAFTVVGILITVRYSFRLFFVLSLITIFFTIIAFLIAQSALWFNVFMATVFTSVIQVVTLQFGGVLSLIDRSFSRSLAAALSIAALCGLSGAWMFQLQHSSIKPDWLDAAIALILLVAAAIIGWRASKPNSLFPEIRRWAISIASFGGTSFQGANLTEADFSQARLKHTDFRNANLTRTCWHNAKGLEFARLDNTYLSNSRIRQLVTTLQGQGQSFDGLNLEGVNLDKANLTGASLIRANFNGASLKDADLSGATLKYAQLDGANLSGSNLRGSLLLRANLTGADLSRADLTGACIKDWSFNDETCLTGVICDYVYREFENGEPTDRYPSDRNFKPGEFESLFQKLTNAVELVFQDQVDWRALSFTFEKFRLEDDGMGLELKGIEQRGDYWIVKVTHEEGVSKQLVEQQVHSTYADIRALMESKDRQINQLLGIVDNQTKAMHQQAEALTNFSKQPFGNNFFISGSTITNLAGSGQIEYREAADRVRSLVTDRANPHPILQRLLSQLIDRNVATTSIAQQELIQQILISEANQDPAFRQFLLEQGEQIVNSLPNGEMAIAVQAAIAQLKT